MNKGGRDLVNYMNDHDIIIWNGIKKKAEFSSMHWKGCTVIDYMSSDQSLYKQVRNFKTWQEDWSIVSDHRFLSAEIEGKIEKKRIERKERKEEKKIEEKKKGWRRKRYDESFGEVCEREMKRWSDEYKEGNGYDNEEVWQAWLKTHNKIAEEVVGRGKGKRIRKWLKGEWDCGIQRAIREKNRVRREMIRVKGEERGM